MKLHTCMSAFDFTHSIVSEHLAENNRVTAQSHALKTAASTGESARYK